MKKTVTYDELLELGAKLGQSLRGGELIELVGDVGTGKTTLTKAIARGLEIDEDVQSPSFTISRTYPARDGLSLYHYDFYRLDDPGIMRHELAESLADPRVVTVIEWADSVGEVLPNERIVINLGYAVDDATRVIEMHVPSHAAYIQEAIS